MHQMRIERLAVMLAMMVLALSARAEGCLRIPRPTHDWTFRVGTYQFGIQGYSSWTEVYYGHGAHGFSVPFTGAVMGMGVGIVALCTVGVVFVRRR